MDSATTNINGLPAKYVLTKNPNDTTRESYIIAKVLDVPERSDDVSEAIHPNPIRIPSSYIAYNFGETPLHLCDPALLVTQYRCGDYNLSHRIVDTSKNAYTEEEMKWYTDPESKIPPPKRLVMIAMLRCYLCGDFQKNGDDIHYEDVGEHLYGYRYCSECKPYFLGAIYKTIVPIMKFRLDYEAWIESSGKNPRKFPFIWVARTRRDENGQRIVKGNKPYLYMKWRIINWVSRKHIFPRISIDDVDTIVNQEEDSLTCEQIEETQFNGVDFVTIVKLVPIRDIYITNLVTDVGYDPNMDDPLNKYSEKEQREMFAAAFT